MADGVRDFYEVLGIPRTASAEEIQRAYRQLARRHHPDVNKDPGSEARFKEIAEAYDVLSNPATRARYDRFGPQWRQVPEGFDPDAAPSGARSRAGQGGRAGRQVWVDTGEGEVDLEDLLGELFGGRAGPGGPAGPGGRAGPGGFGGGGFGGGPVAGADAEAEITLTVEEAYAGGRRHITLATSSGTREYDVNIPAGVTDGQRIRLAGQGSTGMGGGAAGDLYLVVRLAPHPRYRVNGRDITADLLVTPWEAALGAKVPLDTPGGTAKVDVPPGSSSGRRLRLRGRGLPNPRGAPGDFYAAVRVMVPPGLTSEERRLFEQLAKVSSFDPRSGHGRSR